MSTKSSRTGWTKGAFATILRISAILALVLASAGFSQGNGQDEEPNVWDGAYLMKPTVLQEKGGYMLWYDGADSADNIQVGLAWSRDGKKWKKSPKNPVLDGAPGAWDGAGEHAPFVIKEGGLYKMWYEGSDGSVRQLGYATSRDGVTWEKFSGNPVLRAGPEEYDQLVAGHGTVLHEDGLYKLWYHAIGDLHGTGSADALIAYATSPDGLHWTKHGPVLVGTADGWDTDLWGPSVVKVKGVYWMWYAAGGPDYPISIGLARSRDGINWKRVGDKPVITDLAFINNFADPQVIHDGKTFKMWMGNFSEDRAIYYAESRNGVAWTRPVAVLFPGTDPK